MSDFNDFFRRGQNSDMGKVPYFEDTHDAGGNYIGSRFGAPQGQIPQGQAQYTHQQGAPVQSGAPQYTYMPLQQQQHNAQYGSGDMIGQPIGHNTAPHMPIGGAAYGETAVKQGAFATMSIETKQSADQNTKSLYNIVIYEPRELGEAQAVIDYLTRREPAIINLDKIPETVSQRLLDFVCGATYALGGKVQRVAGGDNVFLLVPNGVEISTVAGNSE